MLCVVYKSLRQFDYYLYLRQEDEFTRVPDGLKLILGELEKILELELHEKRSLAQVDVREVLRQIDAQGYFLQMPPRKDAGSDSE